MVPKLYLLKSESHLKCDTNITIDTKDVEVKLNVDEILAWGKTHFTYTPEEVETTDASTLKDQKKRLNTTLGLQFLTSKEKNLETELIEDHDLDPDASSDKYVEKSDPINPVVSLSSRQKNIIRRKERAKKRNRGADAGNVYQDGTTNESKSSENSAKIPKLECMGLYQVSREVSENSERNWDDTWPFVEFAECLFNDLQNIKWEIRHGAATALREIIIHHGFTGKENGLSPTGGDSRSKLWLTEAAKLLLCVVANDRFGDFLSDEVVAPVRETSAMALGAAVKLLHPEICFHIIDILLSLLDQSEWQTRHGSILAIKYFLIAKPPSESDTNKHFLKMLYPGLIKGLNDDVDDVAGSTATALIPIIKDLFIQDDNIEGLSTIIEWLWKSLEDIDELSTSTTPILKLLSTILKHNIDQKNIQGKDLTAILCSQNLSLLIRRILPFLYHSSTTVRHSALETLYSLTSLKELADLFLDSCIESIIKHLFQQALLENNKKNTAILESIWNAVCEETPLQPLLEATCPMFGIWLNIATQIHSQPLPEEVFVYTVNEHKYIGGSEGLYAEDAESKDQIITRARCLVVRLLGKLACFIVKPVPGMDYSNDLFTPIQMLVENILLPMLKSNKSAYKQCYTSLVISEWMKCQRVSSSNLHLGIPSSLKDALNCILLENANYDETLYLQKTLQVMAIDLFKDMRSLHNVEIEPMKETSPGSEVNMSLDQIKALATSDTKYVTNSVRRKDIEEKQNRLLCDLNELQESYLSLKTMALSSIAGAIIYVDGVGDKLNPLIKPVMEAIKLQHNLQLQTFAAENIPKLLEICLQRGLGQIAEKVIKNLTLFAAADFDEMQSLPTDNKSQTTPEFSILSMRDVKNEKAERIAKIKKSKKGGTTKIKEQDKIRMALEIQKRGAAKSLNEVVVYFSYSLPKNFPQFWEIVITVFQKICNCDDVTLINSLQTFETVVAELAKHFKSILKECLPAFSKLSMHKSSKIRNLSARCLAKLALPSLEMSSDVVSEVVDSALPLLEDVENVHHRQGSIEIVYLLTTTLGLDIIPYIVLFIIPVLGRMSDMNVEVRFTASCTFASLVKLIPLDNTKKQETPSLNHSLMEKKLANQKFVDELLDPVKNIEEFKIPVKVNAKFRSYQLDGIKWLAFLHKYNLHGILCDDMGLGKTIQTLTVLVSSHYNAKIAGRSAITCNTPLPSLVICPSTVCGHWKDEIRKFIANRQDLDCLIYGQKSHLSRSSGNLGRNSQKEHIMDLISNKKVENLVVISSYDIVRSDVEFFSSLHWNYLVLDEGHVIKNNKSKTTQAIKSLHASHRLILSGTPIQNSVLDLWSLFDFLMPGFLGSEKQFNNNFGKPIISSRNSKDKVVQGKGALAIESLHRQVLPFILRRMKTDVLKDLPPKIIQDQYCDLSPLQLKLYDDCVKRQKSNVLSPSYTALGKSEEPDHHPNTTAEESDQSTHVFQTLQYLRKVCNHPKLVLDEKGLQSVNKSVGSENFDLNDIKHSGKLPALQELLYQCGIGVSSTTDLENEMDLIHQEENVSIVGQHRALIFFQLKSMIDIVENDLLKKLMPDVTYLRLDGSVPASNRHSIVRKFNQDVTIDLLLLTTSVGGLGLNLTGADTVIFVEQDWNPMKDLQAMDRAHRIGQKRVVNVYRLISRGTIEEKILGIQQFKLKTANTVISTENSSMANMMTESNQIIDLFSSKDECDNTQNLDELSKETKKGMTEIINSLPELWDVKEYEDEYDVSNCEKMYNK